MTSRASSRSATTRSASRSATGQTNVYPQANAAAGPHRRLHEVQRASARPPARCSRRSPRAPPPRSSTASPATRSATRSTSTPATAASALESRKVTAVGTPTPLHRLTSPALTRPRDRRRRCSGSGPPTQAEMAVTPRLIARLELTYADGTTDAIASATASFAPRTARRSPTTGTRAPTTTRARVQPGWDEPGADLTAPERLGRHATGITVAALACETKLVWREAPPVRVRRRSGRSRSSTSARLVGRSTSARTSPACRSSQLERHGPRGHGDQDVPGESWSGNGTVSTARPGRRAASRHLHDRRRRRTARRSPRSSCTTASSTSRSPACPTSFTPDADTLDGLQTNADVASGRHGRRPPTS